MGKIEDPQRSSTVLGLPLIDNLSRAQGTERTTPTRLIVFADEWGGHPSSCQHLVRHLLARYPTVWVNTIGTRRPAPTRADAEKAVRTLRQWFRLARPVGRSQADFEVVAPIMWPGFRRGWQRRVNRRLISGALRRALGSRNHPERRLVLTTLPIVAGLIGSLDADAWVYYCVDDFSVWPGLDGRVMEEMERCLLHQVDCIVAASSISQQRFATMGYHADLLTHGVDLAHWGSTGTTGESTLPLTCGVERLPEWMLTLPRPLMLFWGLIDARLDAAWIRALQDPRGGVGGSLVLLGPSATTAPVLRTVAGVHYAGPVSYASLPRWAARADVLVMPYADLPVTRTMQPLKLKEYLATGKPVVVRSLPATRTWADAADVVDTPDNFVAAVARRVKDGVPTQQLIARRRLINESWEQKAKQLEAILLAAL